MRSVTPFRLFVSILCVLAFATTAANGGAIAIATLLTSVGIGVTDPKCSSSWDWISPLFRTTEPCGCRQSYVIVQSHSKDEENRGPKMEYDHFDFENKEKIGTMTSGELVLGSLCQHTKTAIIPPMGAGGAEVGNAQDAPGGLVGGKLYWYIYGIDGVKLPGCQLVVSVDNYSRLGFGKNSISGAVSGCESYTAANQVPGLTVDMSEFIEKEEGAARIIYVYMKGAPPIAQAASVDEDIPWPEEPSSNSTGMAPGMAPGAAPTPLPSPKPDLLPSSSPAPVPVPPSSSSLALPGITVLWAAALAAIGAAAF